MLSQITTSIEVLQADDVVEQERLLIDILLSKIVLQEHIEKQIWKILS
jgi:hypothetical protein